MQLPDGNGIMAGCGNTEGPRSTARPYYRERCDVSDYQSLRRYGLKCCNGGRWKASIQTFEMCLIRNTAAASKALKNGTFKPARTYDFMLRERGKWRTIRAHTVQDRQVYKALCENETKPMMGPLVLDNNNASQKNRGTGRSIKQFRRALTRAYKKCGRDFYVITYDFHDYFGSIPKEGIMALPFKEDLKWLINDYIDLFPNGIGIGGEPSQDIAVVYPHRMDRMIACEPCVIGSGRYMDDGYVVIRTKEEAQRLLAMIREYSMDAGLVINNKRTKISHMTKDSVTWLKKRTFVSKTGKIVMRPIRGNITEELRRIKIQKKLIDSGKMPQESADQSIQCWCSYVRPYNASKSMMRVVNEYCSTFEVDWKLAKILLRRRPRGWITNRKLLLSKNACGK